MLRAYTHSKRFRELTPFSCLRTVFEKPGQPRPSLPIVAFLIAGHGTAVAQRLLNSVAMTSSATGILQGHSRVGEGLVVFDNHQLVNFREIPFPRRPVPQESLAISPRECQSLYVCPLLGNSTRANPSSSVPPFGNASRGQAPSSANLRSSKCDHSVVVAFRSLFLPLAYASLSGSQHANCARSSSLFRSLLCF